MSAREWMFQLRKLKNVRRCGVLRVHSPESVAEHSFFVTALVTEIGRLVEKRFPKVEIDWPTLIQKALFHDIEEGITGDIPYPVKHGSKKLNELIEETKNQIVGEFFPTWVVQYNVGAKKEIEGEIVNIADYVELYYYCAEEIMMGSRDRYWREIMQTCRNVCENKIFSSIATEYFNSIDEHIENGGLNEENTRISGRCA